MKFLFISISIFLWMKAGAQEKPTAPCSNKMRKDFTIIPKDDKGRMRRGVEGNVMIKLFFVVPTSISGTPITSEVELKNEVATLNNSYGPYNICFAIGGIRFVSNADLITMDIDEEEGELEPYMEEGFLTVFMHNSLFDSEKSYSGFAYSIPNNYLSMTTGSFDRNTLAHEIGHCLGLMHTFEDGHGVENRERTKFPCKDCEVDGDLICDTPADRELDASEIDATTCNYTGSLKDDCDELLYMAPTNIMTYSRASCRRIFTNGQNDRMRYYLESDVPEIMAMDNVFVFPGSYNSGYPTVVAKQSVSFQGFIEIVGSARFNAVAKEIIVKPGTHFKPGSQGYAHLRTNPYCN